jgi:membrane-bound lytic murein transglycosylase A
VKRDRLGALAALALCGCATVEGPAERRMPLQELPGWAAEDHAAALALVRRVCSEAPRSAGEAACAAAAAAGPLDEAAARRFLETRYRAEVLPGEGVLTAYYSPTYEARRSPEGDFTAPVRPGPPSTGSPGPTREAIEASPAPDALAWMRPEDLFFLQIQGGGTLTLADRTAFRAAYAGSNGRPFTAMAGPMVEKGLMAPGEASASAIHVWLARHRGAEAAALMRLNERYIFFRLAPDNGADPIGAAGAALIAGRSLAVDPARHRFFDLLWIDADRPALVGARPSYRRLTAAMDQGAAIVGEVRADLYLGRGSAAGAEAGSVRHALRLYRIVPAEAG